MTPEEKQAEQVLASVIACLRQVFPALLDIHERAFGNETPWDMVPPCPYCHVSVGREELNIPVPETMEMIIRGVTHELPPRMRPIVMAQFGHLEVCPGQCQCAKRNSPCPR